MAYSEKEKLEYVKEKEEAFLYLKNEKCSQASSVMKPIENTLVFVRSEEFYTRLLKSLKDRKIKRVFMILDENIEERKNDSISLVKKSKYSEILFAEYHNTCSYKNLTDNISKSSFIHESSVVGIAGLWTRKTPDERVIKMKHVGNVILEDGVYIDACTTIHRGTFGSTVIKKNTILSCHINVGHNCEIGENCFIGPHVGIGGSTKIGDNVNIWQGAMIRNGIEICSNVAIGMGSVVTKSITIPGTYIGTPAKMISPEVIKV